jgi:hypothetical protein
MGHSHCMSAQADVGGRLTCDAFAKEASDARCSATGAYDWSAFGESGGTAGLLDEAAHGMAAVGAAIPGVAGVSLLAELGGAGGDGAAWCGGQGGLDPAGPGTSRGVADAAGLAAAASGALRRV